MAQDYAVRWTITPAHPIYREEQVEDTGLVRDATGEVLYYDEDTAVAEAMRLQDKTVKFSYTVEHRPADGVYA